MKMNRDIVAPDRVNLPQLDEATDSV